MSTWLRVTHPSGVTESIRDPAPNDPELWYWTAVDLIQHVRGRQPNRNLGATDRLMVAGEWELAIQVVFGILRDDPEPMDLVLHALKERIDRLRPDTLLWDFWGKSK